MSKSTTLGLLTMVQQIVLQLLLWLSHLSNWHSIVNYVEKIDVGKPLFINYSAVMLFSTVLCTGGMVQIVWWNCPDVVSMVQLSQIFLHKIVTIRSIELPKKKPKLLKCASWLLMTRL